MSSPVKIMLDPGHGGSDPGAVRGKLQEKDITLRLARMIREYLKEENRVTVRMTREKDIYLSLDQRAQCANTWQADYFLSLHINAGGGSGFESYIYPDTREPTRNYQAVLHQEIIKKISLIDRGRKTANFAVLRKTTMPALLTENLFIDQDARLLREEEVLHNLAIGHADGIKRLLQKPYPNISSKQAKMYRVVIDGKQTGAFKETANILRQVEQNLGTAKRIYISER